MRYDTEWKDYGVIATGNGMKLERFGEVVLLRPDPQIIWEPPFDLYAYPGLSAVYMRNSAGGGQQAEKYTQEKLNTMLFSTVVDPHWFQKGNNFWFE